MNFQQITQKLIELDISPEMLAHLDDKYFIDELVLDQMPDWHNKHGNKTLIQIINQHICPVEIVYSFGGEGKGNTCTDIFYFKWYNVYIKIDAFYSSYDGRDYSDSEFIQVFPKQVTQTIYETIPGNNLTEDESFSYDD